jgi:hypothetical protein
LHGNLLAFRRFPETGHLLVIFGAESEEAFVSSFFLRPHVMKRYVVVGPVREVDLVLVSSEVKHGTRLRAVLQTEL